MDAVSGYGGARPGGKIVRQRRRIAARTPYDRPILRSRDPPQQNPSWISRLVYKPASVIASGAGKFISSVVFSESSSSSSSDTDSASDIDDDEDVEKNVTDFTEDETMEENPLNAEQPTLQRTSTKHVIEQLLMQETFTRDECDRLIDIIKARVLEDPSNDGLTSDGNLPEMSTKAVMEARKWLEEKKSASSLKYNPSSGNSPFALPQATEDGAGSPVDLAKSYMRTTRASPAVNNSDFLSPSPTGMQFPKEGTPFSYSAGNFSSSKLKRGSQYKQSWNIHEEIRKVRAKATEEMLKSGSPGSVTSLEPYRNPYVLATDIFKRNSREMFLPCSNPVDASLNADEGVQAVRNVQSEYQVDDLQNSTIPTSEQNQTTKANQANEEIGALHSRFRGEDASDETFMSTQGVKPSEDMNTAPQSGADADEFDDQDGPSSPIGNSTQAVLALGATVNSPGNLCVPKDVFETSKEVDDIGAEHPTSNGFPSSTPSSPVPIQTQPESNPPVEENHRLSSSQDKPNANMDISNAHADPPTDNPVRNGSDTALNNSASSGSHNSSSSREEEWRPEEHSLPNSNSASSSPVYTKVRSGGRGRGRSRGRGRGRGKGRAK